MRLAGQRHFQEREGPLPDAQRGLLARNSQPVRREGAPAAQAAVGRGAAARLDAPREAQDPARGTGTNRRRGHPGRAAARHRQRQ